MMEITITNTKTLESLRNEFTNHYKNLKLEFFNLGHGQGEASPLSEMIAPDKSIGEIRRLNSEITLQIDPEMKVGEMEAVFQKEIGVAVQIFHRSGNRWVQSTTTDFWTLKKLNNHNELTSNI